MWWQTFPARVDFLALRGHSDSHSAEAVDPHHPASPFALIRLYIEPPGTMPHAVGAGKVGKQSSSIILAHATQTCLLRPPLPIPHHRFRRPQGTQSVGVPAAAFAQPCQ
jgi:hypothetical protein